MGLTVTITDAGRAALRNAAGNGTNAVTVAAVGLSSQAFAPGAAIPAEIKRLTTISGGATAADTIHVTVLDSGGDDYSVYGFALYLSDGTLFASYGQSTVIVEKSAQAMMQLALDVRFVDVAASSISFGDANFMNPAATEDTLGVVKLASADEASAGTDSQKVITPETLSGVLNPQIESLNSSLSNEAKRATAAESALTKSLAQEVTRAEGVEATLMSGTVGMASTDLQGAGMHYSPASATPQFAWYDASGAYNSIGLATKNYTAATYLPIAGNATSAAKLATARTISFTGAATGGAAFDGTRDVSIGLSIADASLTIAKTSGLQTALNALLPLAGGTMTGALTTNGQIYGSDHTVNINYGPGDGYKASFQNDGNLVLYNANVPYGTWRQDGFSTSAPANFKGGLQASGTISLPSASLPIETISGLQEALNALLPLTGGTLSGALTTNGQIYGSSQSININYGPSNGYKASFQSDGNLVLYKNGASFASVSPSGSSIPGISSSNSSGVFNVVINGMRIQAFSVGQPAGESTLSFPTAFSAVPIVTHSCRDGTTESTTVVNVLSVTASGCTVRARELTGSSTWGDSAPTVYLIAMGPA